MAATLHACGRAGTCPIGLITALRCVTAIAGQALERVEADELECIGAVEAGLAVQRARGRLEVNAALALGRTAGGAEGRAHVRRNAGIVDQQWSQRERHRAY